MGLISIEERSSGEIFEVAVMIGDKGVFPAKIIPPFNADEEQRLEWYFEEHLRLPFIGEINAKEAAESIGRYGEALFDQLFADRKAYAGYLALRERGIGALRFEIVGSAGLHRLHWEALKDPELPAPFALDAVMVRRSRRSQTQPAAPKPASTINLLVVTARPGGGADVGYRTITRPLVEGLRQAKLRVDVDIVRPGSYRALSEALGRAGAGHYHVVHFDLHGSVLTYSQLEMLFRQGRVNPLTSDARFGRGEIPPFRGTRAFLFFEYEMPPEAGNEAGKNSADPVEAAEVAALLLAHQVPIVILNACQSGKQAGADEASLAERLVEAGVQTVLGMRYSVTVSAAALMMPELYRRLFAGEGLDRAIQQARQLLHDKKERRAYFRRTIRLEDWLLPVVHQQRTVELAPTAPSAAEDDAWLGEKSARHKEGVPSYGFFGRDLDILRIEKRLLARADDNILLLHGMGGTGKSTLLHHLAGWWQQTGLVERVVYCGYDKQAWNRQQIMHEIAEELYDPGRYHGRFLALSEEKQQADLAETLGSERHLLILDNLESITGSALAIGNPLRRDKREEVKEFLQALNGGRTLVLLGSRGQEAWLAARTFGANQLELRGLDPEAASDLADAILSRHGATRWRQDPAFQDLLTLLAGYPLALEVVLANLKRQSPAEILEALRAGAEGVDLRSASKTESILRCIDYSHGNLSPDAQTLLLCLAPFTGVFNSGLAERYSEALRRQPALAELPHERWSKVLQEAIDWGLMSLDKSGSPLLRLQPTFPYFLRTRLAQPDYQDTKAAIETAFREFYDEFGKVCREMIRAKEPRRQQIGLASVEIEYSNFTEALRLALHQKAPIINLHAPLGIFLDRTAAHDRGLALSMMVLEGFDGYRREELTGRLGWDLLGVIDDLARRHLSLRHFKQAAAAYERALIVTEGLTDIEKSLQSRGKATILHQQGRVAQEQRLWTQAEVHFRKALAIRVELDDRHSQASTYQNLGVIALEQQQWPQAEDHFQKALAICVEFGDRSGQALNYHHLGVAAMQQSLWNQAEDYFGKSLAIRTELGDRYSQASTYQNMGTVAQGQYDWTKAEGYYQTALAIKIEFNERYSQAISYHQLGILAQKQHLWTQAADYYQNALAIYAEFNDRYCQARIYRQLGDFALEQHLSTQAAEYYQNALAIHVELDNRYEQASIYGQLGIVAFEQEQWAEAENRLLQAHELFISHGDDRGISIGLRYLADLHKASASKTLLPRLAEVLRTGENEAEKLLRIAAGGQG